MPEGFGDIDRVGIGAVNSPISIQHFSVQQSPSQLSDTNQFTDIPQNIPFRGSTKFLGRTQELETLHQEFQQPERAAIAVIAGMGGIGKTELAIRYAIKYAESYPGGICWLNAKEDLVPQIIQFAQFNFNLSIPQQVGNRILDIDQQLQWCLQYWRAKGAVLVIFDDVSAESQIQQVIHHFPKRFHILLTTRQKQLDASFFELPLKVLSPAAAIALLEALVGIDRIRPESEVAAQICTSLGYLPLGVELVGRYLVEIPFLKMVDLQQRLCLPDEALDRRQSKYIMTAERGIRAAFELSWQELDAEARNVGKLLSLFAEDAIPWYLVAEAANLLDWDSATVAESKQKLYQLHLIQLEGTDTFKLHPLIHEFFRLKLAESEQSAEIQRAFVSSLIAVARDIPYTATRSVIEQVTPAIPHLSLVAKNLLPQVEDGDIGGLFIGLGRFYYNQGLYKPAEVWYEQGWQQTTARLGSEHPDVATSLNNLAWLYHLQGRYQEAEPLYLQSLEMGKRQLGDDHPDVATRLHNLAGLYEAQGRYQEAEPLYLQALEMGKRQLGDDHPTVAISLNSLAGLYEAQGRYQEAEPLYLQALEMGKQQLGDDHPTVATRLHNLAELYRTQGRYQEAEPLYLQALEIEKRQLGDDHPTVATSLHNLAELYRTQGRYQEAEPLYLQSLEMGKRQLGDDHPTVAIHLSNLAGLYMSTLNPWKLVKAIFLQIQSLKIGLKTLGWRHPHTLIGFVNLFTVFLLGGSVSWILISSTMLFIHTLNWTVLLRLVFFLLLVKLLLRWNLEERLYRKAQYQFSKWRATRKGSAK